MFRSEDMNLQRVMFAQESWWQVLNAIASTESCMPLKRNSSYHSSASEFSSRYAKRCEELRTLLSQIEEKAAEFGESFPPLAEKPSNFISLIDQTLNFEKNEGRKVLDELETIIKERHRSLLSQIQHYDQIVQTRMKILNNLEAHKILRENDRAIYEDIVLGEVSPSDRRLNFIVGYLPSANIIKVQKLLFRLSRENTITSIYPIPPPMTEGKIITKHFESKVVMTVLVPSSQANFLYQSISRVLQSFDFVSLTGLASEEQLELDQRENNDLLDRTYRNVRKMLAEFVEGKSLIHLPYFHELRLLLDREIQFAHAMKTFQVSNDLYWIDFWVPSKIKDKLEEAFRFAFSYETRFARPKIITLYGPKQLSKDTTAPSLFSEWAILSPFQLMVETYGVPRYKEINPSLFTIVTFPFMFALMFGDIGHGSILFGLGIYFTFFYDNIRSSIYAYRYLILLLGIFSLYTGLVYNDFFAVPLITGPSCYDLKTFERSSDDCVYHFGIDWIWQQSSNATLFINSFKMKFSIIIGVVHMLFGIALKIVNAFYFRNYVDVLFEAVPQFIFMLLLFGFLALNIIVKWLTSWDPSTAPSIISNFINFFTVTNPVITSAEAETTIHRVFLVISIICVFLMLIPKPIILWRASRNSLGDHKKLNEKDLETSIEDHESSSLGEYFIHQMIETIEFVLGSLSNTASYLRLWALSLAHQQLSEVFLSMIITNTLKDNSNQAAPIFVSILGYLFFAIVTGGIILGMDAMECFLHALRLHWVEFQNKFFKGDGIKFEAFGYSLREDDN